MTTTPAPVVVAAQAKKPRQKIGSEAGRAGWLVNGAMIVLCFLWLLPTIGLLVTSFRSPSAANSSGCP